MTSNRNSQGFYDWKLPITMKEPKPERVIVKKYPEKWCRHSDAEKLHTERSEGESLMWPDGKSRFVTCLWQHIVCPQCKAGKVLVK